MTQFTFFWQNRSPFSNWYPSIFEHKEIIYNTGEQYMMCQKALMFCDLDIATKIMNTKDPKLQKELGRQVSNYNDEDWSQVRFDVMVDGLYCKFSQNEKLKDALLATIGTELVEASPYDLVWGIGYLATDPEAQDKTKWRGQNLLGQVLDKVRLALVQA